MATLIDTHHVIETIAINLPALAALVVRSSLVLVFAALATARRTGFEGRILAILDPLIDRLRLGLRGTAGALATIQQTTLSLDTRISWTFTPRLTLETYVQPFLASGAYSRFREFARTRARGRSSRDVMAHRRSHRRSTRATP